MNSKNIIAPLSKSTGSDLKELVERLKAFLPHPAQPSGLSRSYRLQSIISEEPRTDISPEILAEKPWLRFYPPDIPVDITPSGDTLPGLLRESARRRPAQTAIIYFGHKISYRELDEAADHFALGLLAKGLLPGDRVALMLPNCPQFVIACYGALRAGATVVPCNPLYVERELEHQLRDSGAKILVTLTLFYKMAKAVQPKVGLEQLIVGNIKDYFPPALKLLFTVAKEKKGGHRATLEGPGVFSWSDFLASHDEKPAAYLPEIKADDIALYQYTGGTTGVPKAAVLTHRNLATNTRMCCAWLGERPKAPATTLAVVPFFHVYGMTGALNLTIYLGGTLVLLPSFVPVDVLKAIHRYHPTLFPGVPAMYIALLNHPQVGKYDLNSIEACISGAAPLPMEIATRFEKLTGAKLIEGFGMTEASPVTHGNPVYGRRKDGSIGLPFPGVRAKIVDLDTGQVDLPPGDIGELVVSGPMVMQGYYNRPEETASTIRDGWLYTGDIARMDADGYFYIVDRKKDMILSNGFNVYPRDVEEVLYQHPAVKEAVVIGAPNNRGDVTVKAFVVLKEGQTARTDEIIAFCRERLTRYKAPRLVEFRDELPKTLIGKHLRRVLVEEERKRLATQHEEITPASTAPDAGNPDEKPARKGLHLPAGIGRKRS
jgi:long-chain acyl-CoA synthetase